MKNNFISTRFNAIDYAQFEEIANAEGIGKTEVVQNCAKRDASITRKCLARGDFFMQSLLVKKFYDKLQENEIDEWVEFESDLSMSCMKLFSPTMEFMEISTTIMTWFDFNGKNNGTVIQYEDKNDFRYWVCNHLMGLNWSKIKGRVYSKLFEDQGLEVKNIKQISGMWEFAVKIPINPQHHS